MINLNYYENLRQLFIEQLASNPNFVESYGDLNQMIKIRHFGHDRYFELNKEIKPFLICPKCKSDTLFIRRPNISMEFLPSYINEIRCQKCRLNFLFSVQK